MHHSHAYMRLPHAIGRCIIRTFSIGSIFGNISIFIFSKIRTDTAEIVDIEIRIGVGFEIEIRLVLILTRLRLNSLLEDRSDFGFFKSGLTFSSSMRRASPAVVKLPQISTP